MSNNALHNCPEEITLSTEIAHARRLLYGLVAGTLTVAGSGFTTAANASSHREAPFISQNPSVDATDFYMFRSYEGGRRGFVTLIANYIPLQDPSNGPNFARFDQNALYEIHVDNNGDGQEDLTFQFRFTNTIKNIALTVGGKQVPIPLINAGQIMGMNPSTLNVRETYSVSLVRGSRRFSEPVAITSADTGAAIFDKPVDNIGNKSIPDYAGYAAQHVYNLSLPGCNVPGSRMFVGQRKESFVINIGEVFDLVNIPPGVVTGAESARRNDLENKNITTIALEVPIACLTAGTEPVIGGWTTASVRQTRQIAAPLAPGVVVPNRESGKFSQVSRLGMPLVNEVVIGLKDKDRFNASEPAEDGQFIDYVTNPTLPALLQVLFSANGVVAPTNFPRTDLVTTFLTGIPGLNKPGNVTPSEMLRLNTTTEPAAVGAQNRLGVIGGDTAGFPNGRRPGDDVVDIALRVVMGKLCTLNAPAAFGCIPADALSGNINFTDGAITSSDRFGGGFPYLTTPIPGSPQQP